MAGPGGFATGAELVIVTGNISGSFTAANAAAKIGSASSNYTVGTTALFVVDNGTDSAVFLFTSADTDAKVEANELKLLATLTGTSSMSTSDIGFAG